MTMLAGGDVGTNQSNRLSRIKSIRRRIVELSFQAKSAHLGSSLSCVEILDSVMELADIHPDNAAASDRSRIIFSKGHAAMAFYCTLEAWRLAPKNLLDNYLQNGTSLWGHVSRSANVPAIDVSTGSLGHGLSLAVGYGLGYRMRKWPAPVFGILSDGECDEGSTWEAALFAGHHKLDNVSVVVDYNKIQSLDRVSTVLGLEPFANKWDSFGWTVVETDGHDTAALDSALVSPRHGRPLIVLAHTIKGKGIDRIEDTVASHYHPATADDVKMIQNA